MQLLQELLLQITQPFIIVLSDHQNFSSKSSAIHTSISKTSQVLHLRALQTLSIKLTTSRTALLHMGSKYDLRGGAGHKK
jgi:hypothetical protein